MNAEDCDDLDLYITQLKDVFDSCDIYDRGYLSRYELLTLCQKLQLDSQAEIIVDCLMKNVGSQEIAFDQFKDIFMQIICEPSVKKSEVDGHDIETWKPESDTGEEDSVDGANKEDSMVNGVEKAYKRNMEKRKDQKSPVKKKEVLSEIPPRYVKGEKKYGRRSRPLHYSDHKTDGQRGSDTKKNTVRSAIQKKKSLIPKKTSAASKEDDSEVHPKLAKLDNAKMELSSEEDVEKEMFEAEGQLNLTMSELEQAQSVQNDVNYLRNIWKTLQVGQNGYITVNELEKVCDHIGMEKMNEEELQQLFDKLDLDKDGHVSFEEFIGGTTTTHISPVCTVTTTPRAMTPRSSSAQKKIRVPPPSGEDRTTPSIIQGIGASGLFSVLDPDHTGFSMPENVVDLWEKYNVTNGTDVLLALEFDLVTKVNLSELSFALEQVMLGADDQNAVYQAAFASYQQEIRHLKSVVEQQLWAMDKLKLDLNEANARNAMLAKEVDERHLHIEQSTEKRLIEIDKKYQEQVKSLQSDLESERQRGSAQVAAHKAQLQSQMNELKQEEGKIRDTLLQAQKDIERLETENVDVSERLTESEKLNSRLQKHLEDFNDIQSKLDEYETAGILSPEQLKFVQEKLVKTESENKVLKDINDELKAEVETLNQQIVSTNTNVRGTGSKANDFKSRIPVKMQTGLTDDSKAKRKAKSIISSETSEDEEVYIASITGRIHRRLPIAPEDDDVCSVSSLQSDSDYIEILKKVITDMKIQHEREMSEQEHIHKKRMLKMEQKQEQDKRSWQIKQKQLQDHFLETQDKDIRLALIENQQKMKEEFVAETRKIQEAHDNEIKMLKEKFWTEKQHIIDNLQAEFKQELEAQVIQVKDEKEQEKNQLIQTLSYPVEEYRGVLQEKTELEERMVEQKEAMEIQFNVERERMQEELETVLRTSEKAMTQLEKEKLEMSLQMKQKMENMQSEFMQRKQALERDYEQELRKMEERNQLAIQNLELKANQERNTEKLTDRLKENIDRLQREKRTMEDKIDSLQREKRTMGENIETLQRDKRIVEGKIEILQEEKKTMGEKIESLQREKLNMEEKMECLQKDRSSNGGKIESLQREKQTLEEKIDNLQKERRTMGEKIETLQRERRTLEETHVKEKEELFAAFGKEKEDLMKKYEEQVQQFQQQLKELQNTMADEGEKNKYRLTEERRALEEEITKAVVKEFEEKLTALQLERNRLQEELKKYTDKNIDSLKRNLLVVDLYKENANLMEALHMTEVRKKDAVSKCYKLEERCKALRVMLNKVSHIAVS